MAFEIKIGKSEQVAILNPLKTKALFIKAKPHMDMTELFKIAKAQARKIGMKPVQVVDYHFSEKASGWSFIVQEI